MKRIIKVLIIGAALIVAGVLVSGISLGAVSSKYKKAMETGEVNNLSEYEKNEVSFPISEINDIYVNLSSTGVKFVPTKEAEVKVTYYEKKGQDEYEVKAEDGVLNLLDKEHKGIDININLLSFDDFFGDPDRFKMVVEIPEEYAGTYDVQLSSGGVSMADINSSGDIWIRVTSGGISLENISSNSDIKLGASSGGINLDNIETEKEIKVSVTSGGIKGNQLKADTVDAESSSGGIRLTGVDVSTGIKTTASSGGISVGMNDSVENYTVYSKVVSGGSNLSDIRTTGSKTIEATATSGGISYTFAE